jgi:hypothetical protein
LALVFPLVDFSGISVSSENMEIEGYDESGLTLIIGYGVKGTKVGY